MKKCPLCSREYDDTMRFCLDDGSELLYGPGNAQAIFDPTLSEAPTIAADLITPISGDLESATIVMPSLISLSERSDSIAVLPFVNMSADPTNEYLCDGLAEELLNALSKIEDLKVAARTSAVSFKGTRTSIGTIGQQLGVHKVLEGSVRSWGDRVRITVKLVNADDGYQIWSQSFDRELNDIFAIEDEITLAVVKSLKLKVFGEKRDALVKRYTGNADAYQLYLMGRFHFNKFNEEGCLKAIEYFEQTLALEPEYAPAFAGIAEACGMLWYISTYAKPELVERERVAVERAIELEPRLAESYRSRALLRCYVDWDFSGAERDYRKCLELNPNDALAHAWYALWSAAMGRREDAVKIAKKARSLDPLSVNGALMSGWAMWFSGNYDGALDTAMAMLEIEPESFELLRLKGCSLWGLDDLSQAKDALERSVELGSRPLAHSSLCVLMAQTGDIEGANAQLAELHRRYDLGLAPAASVAYGYLALNRIDDGFLWLERGFDNRDGEMIFMRAWPRWLNPVYDDPKFADLIRRIGLPAMSD